MKTSIHKEPHPLAGQTVKVKSGKFAGRDYHLEDWWDRLGQGSWKFCDGNPACLDYALRTGFSPDPVPLDDEVVYGKIGGFGKLIHVSELA